MEICQSRRFSKGVDHFERRFQREGASPTNHCWYQSSRVIALSCGIKISAVHHSDFSQSTRVTDGQNYDSQDRPRICSCGNNGRHICSTSSYSINHQLMTATIQTQINFTTLNTLLIRNTVKVPQPFQHCHPQSLGFLVEKSKFLNCKILFSKTVRWPTLHICKSQPASKHVPHPPLI